MTMILNIPTIAQHNASHDPAACCWLCDTGPAWWADVRKRKGLDAPPYPRPIRDTHWEKHRRLMRIASASWEKPRRKNEAWLWRGLKE